MPLDHDANSPKQTVVGEHYRLIAKLGEGAFGEVYRAQHELLQQDFAVKLLRPELCENQDVRDRFLDEARALIRFSHPNVVQLRHVGEHEGRLFLVMDFVEGVELTELMRTSGPLEEKRALNLMKQLLAGLEAAHAAGIVHRDLKPSNILVESRADGTEHAKILDFGLSKFSAIDGQAGGHRSITGTIVGTLAYMSPEQIKGDKDIDGRSDLFAVGLILQEMLQGHHPYPGESGIVVAAKLLRDPIPPIDREKHKGISTTTVAALGRALERDRDARFPSVTAFAQSLEGRGPPSDTSRVATVLEAQQELARQEAESARQTAARSGGGAQKKPPLALIGVIVLALAAGGWFVFGPGKDKPEDTGGGTPLTQAGQPPRKGTPSKVDPTPPVKKSDTPALPKKKGSTPTPPPPPPEKDDAPPPPAKQDDPASKADAPPTKADPVEPKVDAPPQETPVTIEPPPVEPTPPPAVDTPTPAACCDEAAALAEAGDWAGARKRYREGAQDTSDDEAALTSPLQVRALRGAAETWMREADGLARSGRVEDALVLYQDAIAWLHKRHEAYEGIDHAVEKARLQLGFSRMYQGEAHTERARWMKLQGDAKGVEAELKLAANAFEFAQQQLDKDRENYWEFLVRRAQMHGLQRRADLMMKDLEHPTSQSNESKTLAHMWVAHATGARRVAQAWSRAGDAAKAEATSREAATVAEKAVSWKDGSENDALTRRQWLAMARVLFVRSLLQPRGEDPTPLHGKIVYWLRKATETKPAAWEHAEVARARLLTGQAMERYLNGRRLAHGGKQAEAAQSYAQATADIEEALRLRAALAAQGGEQVDGLPHEVLAAVQEAQGMASDAAASREAASKAYRANPDGLE